MRMQRPETIGEALEAAAASSRAGFLITSATVKSLLGTIQADAPTLERVVTIDALVTQLAELRPVGARPDDLCFLQFTSGSTARPKGVMLTHANLTANLKAIL